MDNSRKRARDNEEDDSMTRVRPAPNSAAMTGFSSLSPDDRAALERTAALLNVPLAALLRQKEQAVQPLSVSLPAAQPETLTSGPRDEARPSEHFHPSARQPPSVQAPSSATPVTNGPRLNSTSQFSDMLYGYEIMEDWPNADDSPYRNPDQVLARNRNGFLRVTNENAHPPSTPEHRFVNGAETTPSPGGVTTSDLSDAAISTLLSSATEEIESGRVVSDSASVSDLNTFNDADSSEWSLVPMYSGPPDANQETQVGTGREIVPVTFVSFDPLEPPTQARPKRGAFRSDQLREETHKTRQLKACLRCRMQRVRCSIDEDNPTGTCLTCQSVLAERKMHNLPCLRYRLTECVEFRTGKAPGMEYSARWPVMKLRDISEWASPEIRTITVMSDVSPVPFNLKVRKFVPIRQDSLHRAWMDGKIKKFRETTPYAIADMRRAMSDMRQYLTDNTFISMDYFLQHNDELIRMTFKYAKEYMSTRVDSDEEAQLLSKYMKLWVAVRRTATLEHIVSQETLDMVPESEDKSFPLLGKVPLPPVMIQQLDIILTLGVLRPLQKQVMEDLQKLILSNNPRTWMTMYLITFMSLKSCASLMSENYRNARRQGYRRRYSFPSFIQERHNSANVLLSHYHYRTEPCNPFKLDWKRRHATPFADMTTQDVIFLQKTNELLAEKSRAESIRLAREHDLYENDLYFISQLYEDNWQPRDMKIDYDGGTIHGGPVKKYYTEPTKS